MDKNHFWIILESAIKKSRGDRDRLLDSLAGELAKLAPPAIVKFQLELNARMDEAMTWPLWGAAYLLQDGCSDDMFEYFRALLIANGRKVFERVVADPDSLASTKLRFGEEESLEFESLLYVPAQAHEKAANGRALPKSKGRRTKPKGKQWAEADLPGLLPRLAKKLKREASKGCPMQPGQVFRLALPYEPEGTAYAYFKVIGLASDPEESKQVVVMLLNYPPPNATPRSSWDGVPHLAMRYYEPYEDPNGRREVGRVFGWVDEGWSQKAVGRVSMATVTPEEAKLARKAKDAPYGHSFIWGWLAEDAQGSFDPSVWPVFAFKPKMSEMDLRLEAMSPAEIDAAADQLAVELRGVSRRYSYLTSVASQNITKHHKYDKALALLRVAERIMPLFHGVWMRKAEALYRLGRKKEAEAAWKTAVETSPANLRAEMPSFIRECREEIDEEMKQPSAKSKK